MKTLLHSALPTRPSIVLTKPRYIPDSHRAPLKTIRCDAQKSDSSKAAKAAEQEALKYRPPSREGASLRAEAEAPFRSLRVVLFGFGVVSASIATLFSLPRVIGSLANAPNAAPVLDILTDLGINVAALALCGYFLNRDLQAREQQINRLLRADQLGACRLELANGKLLRLAQLRSFARAVLIAGTPEQVSDALKAAEPYKDALIEAGVLVVGLPMYGDRDDGAIPPLTKEDLRWRAEPIRLNDWKEWFDEQAKVANKPVTKGLYVGLRLDGRVRASGVGCPPWAQFAAQLPPTTGFFQGFLDGMDGRV